MKKNQKLLIVFVCLIVVLGGLGIYYKQQNKGNENLKTMTLEIVSSKDDVNQKKEYKTDKEYLGEFLKEENLVDYENSDYGMYIRTVDQIKDDPDNNYYWSIYVNDKLSEYAADKIVIEEGSVYKLELIQF